MDSILGMVDDSANPDLPVQEVGDSKRAVVATIRSTGIRTDGFTIPLEEIHLNENQIRKEFDLEKLKKLAESIKTNGLLQPLAVERCSNGKNICIDGERRYRALQIIKDSGDFGKVDPEKVPVYTSLDTRGDEILRSLLGMIANDMREGNTEADKSRMIAFLIKKGAPRELILQRTMMSKGTCSKYIKVGETLSEDALRESSKACMALTSIYELTIAIGRAQINDDETIVVNFIKDNAIKKPTVKKWSELIKQAFPASGEPVRKKMQTRPVTTFIKAGNFEIKCTRKRNGINLEMKGIKENVLNEIVDMLKQKHPDSNDSLK